MGKKAKWTAVMLACGLLAGVASAELQNVQVGGKLEIYGAWYSNYYETSGAAVRIPDAWLPGRAIGPDGTISAIRAGEGGNSVGYYEQRTRLHVSADFSDNVKAFIEFDYIDTWGENFRSNYITGADFRSAGVNRTELYQGYIEANEMFGAPLRLRIGRQEMEFGSGWLVGSDPGPDPCVGLSFDAVRLTYAVDAWSVDAWAAKLFESGLAEEDGDADFYGIYASYTGVDNMAFDAYWMWVRDGRGINDSNFSWPAEWLEGVLELDDYDVTNLHTVGFRAAGEWNALDFEAEMAYQFGDADSVGALFVPVGELYGDDRAEFGAWAGHAEIGYTFDTRFTPRAYIGGAYYGGEDNRELSFGEWLNPFDRPEASVSFNRLFSLWREDDLCDASAMSNFWKAYIGATIAATESIEIDFQVRHYQIVEPFDNPVFFRLGRFLVPVAPNLPFWTTENSKDIGWQAALVTSYQYTEDLSFEAGYTHFFVGDAIGSGVAFTDGNGLANIGGRSDEDVDYVYFLTTLAF